MGLRDRLRGIIGRGAEPPAPTPPRVASPPVVAPPVVAPPVIAPQVPVIRLTADTADAPIRMSYVAEVAPPTETSFDVRVRSEAEGLDIRFPCQPNEFVLDAAERAGFVLPYSCRNGGCLTCSARRQSGETRMDDQYVLEEEHVQAGYVLLCCTRVSSAAEFIGHVQAEIT